MIQRFIELGNGYSDIYELLEIGKSNKHRIVHLLALHTHLDDKPITSLVIVLKPTHPGDFQPLYVCREGIPNPNHKANKRYELFFDLATELNKTIIELQVKDSNQFADIGLYYQHLIGILRMNRYLPALQ
ncbi:DUF7147 family protein [Peribacillus loiseleuriae]|uniref:DUF7147 family protein n=1 Tax=Peribacillus loiseleuriae TaxID=1679170 RepID=UPI003CFD9849